MYGGRPESRDCCEWSTVAHVGEGHDPASDLGITDEELTELALAADPDAPLPADAVPIGAYLSPFAAPLPFWYMPPVTRSGNRRWTMPLVLAVVGAFLVIDALGLCNTYGILSFA